MSETAAFRGWKAQNAIEWFHGIGRLVLNFDAGTRFSAIDSTKRAFDRNRRRNWVCFVIPPGSNACASRSGVMMKVDHPDATEVAHSGLANEALVLLHRPTNVARDSEKS
jgi:hypothetical protein